MSEYKNVKGFLWPAEDVDCAAVIFSWSDEIPLALKHCRHMETAVQAGGNTGVWPKKFAEHFRVVYTFEPDPDNFHCLVNNCPEPNIIKLQAAVGDRSHPVGLKYVHGRRNMGAVAVDVDNDGLYPVLRIDDLALSRCDLIQLDIEGYEPVALRGARDTIARFRPVIMVEDKGLSVPYGYPSRWSEAALKDLDYHVVERGRRDVVLAPMDRTISL